MAPARINSPPEPESSEEDLSDSQVSFSSEDDENTNGETEANGIKDKDEFWDRYPSLKTFLSKEIVKESVPEPYVLEKAKLIGDDKAKELNDKCDVLFIKEMEHLINKFRFIADVLELLFL